MHIQLQPHLNKPRGTINTRNFLIGMHQASGLMKHMINTSQQIFSQRDECASSQVFSHHNVVQSWLISFATKDESAQPHIQKGPVLNIRQGTIRHVILNILLVSNSCLYSCLFGGALVLVWMHSFCDIQAGHQVNIGQGRRHWSMTEEEGVCSIRPEVASRNQEIFIPGSFG